MTHTRRQFLELTALGAGGLLAPAAFGLSGPAAPDDATLRFLRAAAAGDLATVERLLDARPALLGAVDEAGRSAFALAWLEGHRPVAELLRERGYATDLHESALAGDWERFNALAAEEAGAVHRAHPIGGSAMYAAARGGAGAAIWRVYAAGGEPNRAAAGAPAGAAAPLQAALRYRDLATAEMTAASLLGNGADPDPPAGVEAPPLLIAAERGSVELVEMLLRWGADPGATDGRGRSAAELAADAGHRPVLELLARQAEIPRKHSTSRTAWDAHGRPYAPPDISAIPQAERLRMVGEAHFSLDYVRDALVRDPRLAHSVATTEEISVESCAHTGRPEIVELLLEHGAPYSLPTAVMRDDRARVAELLDEDPLRIHERGPHGFALLWYPVIGLCGPEMMELLLARGAEVEDQHYLGTTALHWAAFGGQVEVVDLLLARGADVDRIGRKFDAAGQTPLELALARDRTEVARLLRQRGARG